MLAARTTSLRGCVRRLHGAARPLGRHASVAPSSTHTEMTQWLMPSQVNSRGYAQGGVIMSWIDICGAIAAHRCSLTTSVTASMDALHFSKPIYNGDVVTLRGRVNQAWRSSMEVEVEVLAENRETPQHHCVHALLTFVALGDDGKPTQVQPLAPATLDEMRRAQEAEARRARRLAQRGDRPPLHLARPAAPPDAAEKGEEDRDRPSLYASATFAESVRVVMPQNANSYGSVFGGDLMAWAEDLASISAMRAAGRPVATAAVDALEFRAPARVGDAVTVQAQVNRVFRTSMEVAVRVVSAPPATMADPASGAVCAEALMTFAVLPEDGEERQDVSIPDVVPVFDDEVERWHAAKERRDQRLAERATM